VCNADTGPSCSPPARCFAGSCSIDYAAACQ
jgi:hypothetical protein